MTKRLVATGNQHELTAVDPELADALDACEICNKSAVCVTITAQAGELLADMLVCSFCRLGATMRHMRELSRQRVAQLRGEYYE
jgi:hypothetical protein